MGEECGLEPFKFPFPSPEHPSGMATPPLHASAASVPFKWEEQPGKPRPWPEPATRCRLELPPCRLMTKMASPTTVLDGPDNLGRNPKFSSFRLFRDNKQSSFDSSSGSGSPQSAVDGKINKKNSGRQLLKMGRLFGRRRSSAAAAAGKETAEEDEDGGFSPSSFHTVPPVPVLVEGKTTTGTRFSSFSQATPPHWANVYESLKQAIPWKRTRKPNKEERNS